MKSNQTQLAVQEPSAFRQIKEIMSAPAYVEPWPEPLTDREIELLRHQPQLNRGMSLPAMETEDFEDE